MSVNTRRCALAAVTGFILASGAVHAQQPGVPIPGGFGIVDSDGTLGANRNVVKVTHVATGIYRVQFNNDVSSCAANVTLAAHTGRSNIVPGYVVAGRNENSPNQIRVYTFNSVTLVPTDFKFDVLASC